MFTAVTLITLAVGIGANTAIFSVVRGVLLKPLPFPNADRLVGVWETAPGVGLPVVNASPATYFTYREENRTLQDIGMWRTDSVTVTGLGEPEQIECLTVTDGTLPVLGVLPVKGRWFTRRDDSPGSPDTVMLTWGYWQRRFGGDAGVIGRRIMIDGKAHEVIGVMPAGFRFMNPHAGLIVPFQFDRNKVFIGNFSYFTVARLRPGVTLAQANADEGRMLSIMMHKFQPVPGISIKMFEAAHFGPRITPLKDDVIGDVGKTLWMLMATVGIVLLIACANVANLLLVRAEGRQRELAIRTALGAGRGRIARALLGESVTLAIMGGLIGIALAEAGLRLLVKIAPATLPRLEDISLDGPVLLFTIGISVAAGILFGLIPVFKYATPRPNAALREGGRTSSEGRERHRTRNVLVVSQIALALVLLVTAGLMIRTIRAMQQVQPGFTAPEQILTLRVSIPDAEVPKDDQVPLLEQQIAEKLAALPGVSAVGLANSVTMDGNNDNDPIMAEDHVYPEGKIPPIRRFKFVSPGMFHAMGNPVIAGRDFTWTDVFDNRSVIMVSDNLARELWGSPAAAIGKRVRENPAGVWREIIGVAGNERDNGVDQKAPTIAYWPILVNKFWDAAIRPERGPSSRCAPRAPAPPRS